MIRSSERVALAWMFVLALGGCDAGNSAAPAGDAGCDAADLVAQGDGAEFHVGINAPEGHRSALDEGPFLPLSTEGLAIVDAAGREVILRGLQHHALQDVDYGGREVLPEDYAAIASWGFTTLRMAISWSRIEPAPGAYDEAYLDEIAEAMDRAHAAGLTVILEWHQDLWGRCTQVPGSDFAVNANGAPDWTCPDDFTPSSVGHWELFDRFWADEGGLMEAFEAAWGAVIEAVGEHPALLGFDLINEPQGSVGSPTLERDEVFPAFRRLVPALRARGAHGLIFLDAPILRNETFRMYTEPLSDIGEDLVYAPHLYSGWLRLYLLRQRVPARDKERDFAAALEQGAELGLPVWNGEWGVNLLLDGAIEDLEFHVGLEDQSRIGSSYWAFQRAVPGQGDDSISGGQSLLNEDRSVREEVLMRLSRPYPIQTPGRLTRVEYDFASRALFVELEADASIDAPLVVYAPTRHLGERICLEVEGAGGWTFDEVPERQRLLVVFDASGPYAVRLAPCE